MDIAWHCGRNGRRIFILAVYLVVPVSVRVADLIDATYGASMENTIASAKQATDELYILHLFYKMRNRLFLFFNFSYPFSHFYIRCRMSSDHSSHNLLCLFFFFPYTKAPG